MTEVLDKIRDDIKSMTPTYHNNDWSITDLVPISEVLKIVDNYKTESEEKEGKLRGGRITREDGYEIVSCKKESDYENENREYIRICNWCEQITLRKLCLESSERVIILACEYNGLEELINELIEDHNKKKLYNDDIWSYKIFIMILEKILCFNDIYLPNINKIARENLNKQIKYWIEGINNNKFDNNIYYEYFSESDPINIAFTLLENKSYFTIDLYL